MSDDKTIAVYDAKAEEYRQMSDNLYERAELEAFAAAVPPDGRVLDLGCGPGLYAGWLAAKGLTVEAWDASAEMVKMAASQPGVTARQARFDALEANATYDGIWANFSLLHAPKADFPDHLNRIHRAGKPGMAFHIAMKLGDGEGPDRLGRYYAYYSEDTLVGHLEEAGFRVLKRSHGCGPGLDGSDSHYVTMLCHG